MLQEEGQRPEEDVESDDEQYFPDNIPDIYIDEQTQVLNEKRLTLA